MGRLEQVHWRPIESCKATGRQVDPHMSKNVSLLFLLTRGGQV